MNANSVTTAVATRRHAIARDRQRNLAAPGWINSVIDQAKRDAQNLRDASATQLATTAAQLRHHGATRSPLRSTSMLVQAAALMIEAVRQCVGVTLFDVQLHAGLIVSGGAVAEMQTGEGKTLAVALPAFVAALGGRGVHVATPNDYLARRDHQRLVPVFARLGMTAGLLQADASPTATAAAYAADITYGPAHSFGFDYLRDQLTLDRVADAPLGTATLNRLQGLQPPSATLLQRGLHTAIIDEIDHVLIDDAMSPLLLSSRSDGPAADAHLHIAAADVAAGLIESTHYNIADGRVVTLTLAGYDCLYESTQWAVDPALVRPWHEYVVLALRARHCYRRDIDYIVRDGRVQIVDSSTGRIFADRNWSDGLHQAIEANQRLPISCESRPLARITRQRFYRYYRQLGGLTGTASDCAAELACVYGLPVITVPPRQPNRRIVLADHLAVDQREKLAAIAAETQAMIAAGRAVLIGTLSIAESHAVADQLRRCGLSFELLNGIQDADEAAIVARAGSVGAITVATNLAGRGTDILLDPQVARAGGLHVIVTQKHALARVDRQLIGRCARCGDPGTARTYIAADDPLLSTTAPWLGRAVVRWDARRRLIPLNLQRRLARVQRIHQRQETSSRLRLLQTDHDEQKLLARTAATPNRCWQLETAGR